MNRAAHPSVIIHVDIDYFYAQVEEVLNPELKTKPFGIQQGLNVVTCNYVARSFGIKKWRPLKECLEKCPELVLVRGEDLSKYKDFSKRISELLRELIGPSERMGLDEHYLDVTNLVNERLSAKSDDLHMTGPFYPSEEAFNGCDCGCGERLAVGSQIARQIRAKISDDLQLTCSAGVAHNKLLAKLVGQLNKPDNQTTLAPTAAASFMASLKDIRSIFGVGGKTASRIEELGITTIAELQNCDFGKLVKSFLPETATRLKDMSMGRDSSVVKPSEKSKTVGLEDSFYLLSHRDDVEEKFRDLLPHLVERIQDDARIPQSLRVTVRKYDVVKKLSAKETKQFALQPSFFKFIDGNLRLTEGADVSILKNVMTLFDRMVDTKRKYFINLVGLCFTKFKEQMRGAGSIESFLKKKEMKVESDDPEPSPKRAKVEEAEIPSNIDPTVWCELPSDVQRDLLRSWQGSSSSCKTEAKQKSKSLFRQLIEK